MHTGTDYRSLILKGINLGSSPPGYFPGEIAYAISSEQYRDKSVEEMAEAGFNSFRIYTHRPPVFYEKLANYNQRHPDNPLLFSRESGLKKWRITLIRMLMTCLTVPHHLRKK